MTLGLYLWGVRISALLALAAWGAVVMLINPQESGMFGQTVFYLSLFFALSGIFILFLAWLRKITSGGEMPFIYVGMSFRQGILLAALAIILLMLQSFKALTWWDGLLAVAAVFLAELYFLSR